MRWLLSLCEVLLDYFYSDFLVVCLSTEKKACNMNKTPFLSKKNNQIVSNAIDVRWAGQEGNSNIEGAAGFLQMLPV